MSYLVELNVDGRIDQVVVNADCLDGLHEMLDKLIDASYSDDSITSVDVDRIFVRIW